VSRTADASGELVRPLAADVDDRARRMPARRRTPRAAGLGYQPGLDGLRALSVIAVICYHAGFGWMHGGWIGVEVFFVISGFLITSLLVGERERTGGVRLGEFWRRRARRLLPALFVMLAVIAVAALAVGTPAERGGMRRDLPWAIFYLGNWGQIVGGIPYYATDPPLLRHLWSLAIEEQFYLVWPVVFVALTAARLRPSTIARSLASVAAFFIVWTWWLHATGPGPVPLLGGLDRVNFMYLSTFTRAGGLLLGSAAAFVWRPWRRPAATDPGRVLDLAGGVALLALAAIAATATLTAGYVYQWLLPMVTLLSLAVVLVVVHPTARRIRGLLGWRPLVDVGRRSYGLYLWHWPVFVLLGATRGSVGRFVGALAIAVVATELSYRYVELPVRSGSLGRWWRVAGPARGRVLLIAACGVVLLAGCYAAVRPYDRAAGGADATFTPPTTVPSRVTLAAGGQPVAAVTTTAPAGTRLAIVGDSQAHALAINEPDGLDATFAVTDGSVDGCSVYDEGRVRSSRTSFRNYFQICKGWQQEWAAAVIKSHASLALVVLGAWDVFDLETAGGAVLAFGTPAWDDYVRRHLQEGIDALTGAGAHVALLEIPCMRPVPVKGAAVPVLPERADDQRVAHVNQLWQSVAAGNPSTTTFVKGPAWCTDEAMATDVGMRWDGVHVYKPGAKAIFDAIAPALLTM
jgi:peptidoglycan/LPS O-acetylase OafA/YrhL